MTLFEQISFVSRLRPMTSGFKLKSKKSKPSGKRT
jgi:hypothetical protein